MILKKYKPQDLEQIVQLFYDTVHTINAKDYLKEQLNVWAAKEKDYSQWNITFLQNYSIIALIDNKIVGFGDIDDTGYLNRLYVHMNYQNKKIGTSICNKLEKYIADSNIKVITVHASITAKPFFQNRCYHVVREQQVDKDGILLKNFVMKKSINQFIL